MKEFKPMCKFPHLSVSFERDDIFSGTNTDLVPGIFLSCHYNSPYLVHLGTGLPKYPVPNATWVLNYYLHDVFIHGRDL